MTRINIAYRFIVRGGDEVRFDLRLDERTGQLDAPAIRETPGWAALEFEQCPNCPLDPATEALCPVAERLTDVVPKFEPLVSYDQLEVVVETQDRTVRAVRDVQAALSSMIGLIMASSGCPRTVFFRPMARHHLPLANEKETIYRVISNYLVAQHLSGAAPAKAADFEGLIDVYKELQVVNAALTRRLRAAGRTDSTLNAVVLLDLFALLVPEGLSESLSELRELLGPFLEQEHKRDPR